MPFIVGGLPIVTIYFLHRWLPESPRWLMRRGRHDEVRQLVERLEKSAGIEHDDTFINPDVLRSLEQAAAAERTAPALRGRPCSAPPTSPAPSFRGACTPPG